MTAEEVAAVIAAGITDAKSWERRGGGLYEHADLRPSSDA